MRLHRVHPWVEGAAPEEPYGALFIPPGQGSGRWDNPDLYELRYFSTTAEGAIAETFGALGTWSAQMLAVPSRSGAVRALSTYEIPDGSRLADLADPQELVDLRIPRVTHVVERNTRRTQRLAARMFEGGELDGITWWSYYHPSITLVATWLGEGVDHVSTVPLDIEDEAVREAAALIVRAIRR